MKFNCKRIKMVWSTLLSSALALAIVIGHSDKSHASKSQVDSLYAEARAIQTRYGGTPNPSSYYPEAEELYHANGRKNVNAINQARAAIRRDAQRMKEITNLLRDLPGGADYYEALRLDRDVTVIQGARQASSGVQSRVAEPNAQTTPTESRKRRVAPAPPKTRADGPVALNNHSQHSAAEIQVFATQEALQSIVNEFARPPVYIQQTQAEQATAVPLSAPQKTLTAKLSDFESAKSSSRASLESPLWLNSTWHPVLRPPSINPSATGTHDPLNRYAVYYGMLSEFARISAINVPPIAKARNADPHRVQMELAVVFATYVVPFQTLLGLPDWEGSRFFRETVEAYLTVNGQARIWAQASGEWLAPTGKAMFEAMAAHPREVATLLIANSHNSASQLSTDAVAEANRAAEVLRSADARAFHFVTQYGPTLLAEMYAPQARSHYPFPWFIDGLSGNPAKTHAEFGPKLLRGANQLVEGMNGFLSKEKALFTREKCEFWLNRPSASARP